MSGVWEPAVRCWIDGHAHDLTLSELEDAKERFGEKNVQVDERGYKEALDFFTAAVNTS